MGLAAEEPTMMVLPLRRVFKVIEVNELRTSYFYFCVAQSVERSLSARKVTRSIPRAPPTQCMDTGLIPWR